MSFSDNIKQIVVSVILATVLLTGCRSRIKGDLPVDNIRSIPDSWSSSSNSNESVLRRSLTGIFEQEELKKYIKEALENNREIAATVERLKAAGYLLKGKAGELLPSAELELSLTNHNQEINTETLKRGNGKIFKAGINISWEIDIWQRIGDEYRAGSLKFFSSSRELEAFRNSIICAVIKRWLQTTATGRIAANYHLQLKHLRLLKKQYSRRYAQGLAPQTTLLDIDQKLQSAESALISAEEEHKRSRRALEVLSGRTPSASIATGSSIPEISLIKEPVPAEVIRNRPDIQSKIATLKAAGALSRAAAKRMLPSLRLSGSAAKEGRSFKLFRGADILWNLISSLTQPLFAGGRLLAEYKAQKAEAKAALHDLEASVINAVKEVEDALGRELELAENMFRQKSILKNAVKKSSYHKNRYRLGLEDSTSTIMAAIELQEIRNNLEEVHTLLLLNRVDLALACGLGLKITKGEQI